MRNRFKRKTREMPSRWNGQRSKINQTLSELELSREGGFQRERIFTNIERVEAHEAIKKAGFKVRPGNTTMPIHYAQVTGRTLKPYEFGPGVHIFRDHRIFDEATLYGMTQDGTIHGSTRFKERRLYEEGARSMISLLIPHHPAREDVETKQPILDALGEEATKKGKTLKLWTYNGRERSEEEKEYCMEYTRRREQEIGRVFGKTA